MRNQKFYDFVKEHFNEPVIDMFNVVRLVGYEETEEDSYWIYKVPNGNCHEAGGRRTYASSCVGSPILLKSLNVRTNGRAFFSPYEMLDTWLSLNGCEQEPQIILLLNEVFDEEEK